MRTNQYDPDLTPGDLAIRRRQRPITDDEIKGKSSFPPPDQNRLIDIYIKQYARH